MTNAFRAAESDRPGAAFANLPMHIMEGDANCDILDVPASPAFGPGSRESLDEAANMINRATRLSFSSASWQADPKTRSRSGRSCAKLASLLSVHFNRLRELYPQSRFEARRFRTNIIVTAGKGEAEILLKTNGWDGMSKSVSHWC